MRGCDSTTAPRTFAMRCAPRRSVGRLMSGAAAAKEAAAAAAAAVAATSAGAPCFTLGVYVARCYCVCSRAACVAGRLSAAAVCAMAMGC